MIRSWERIFKSRIWYALKEMWNRFTTHAAWKTSSNGVSERRNRTLLDMVRSMMSLTDLPLSFWGYALETATFTLNRAPSKSVETTSYELWFGKKPKLSFLKVWRCDAYVKKLQPEKLKPKSKKCVFIGYPKESIGYTFYLRSEGKIFVAKNGSFLEKEFLSRE